MVVANKLVLAEIAKSVKLRRYDDAKRIVLKQFKLEPGRISYNSDSKNNGLTGKFNVGDKSFPYRVEGFVNVHDVFIENYHASVHIQFDKDLELEISYVYNHHTEEIEYDAENPKKDPRINGIIDVISKNQDNLEYTLIGIAEDSRRTLKTDY